MAPAEVRLGEVVEMSRKVAFKIEETVVLPMGFKAAGIAAGIKRSGGKDIALLFAEETATVAGVFTTNQVKAAPVRLDQERVKGGKARAIIINSGNANACTGAQGLRDAKSMAGTTADCLGIPEQEVLVCSTGAIGKPMPMKTVTAGIRTAVKALAPHGGNDAADAIMTTDTREKRATVRFLVDGLSVTLTGFAKGAGMIEPNMATMLGFFLTDARVPAAALRTALKEVTGNTFNRISVDGDMSTNDTALVLASGKAGNRPLRPGHKDWRVFVSAFQAVALDLARKIARDGEGSTKLITVRVKRARSAKEADAAARAVANSLLVKTCWHGDYPNWGRIMDALGYSPAKVDEARVDIWYDHLQAVKKGIAAGTSVQALSEVQKQEHFTITIDLHLGKGGAEVYTCDCSEEYVKINVDYIKMPDGREPT
jgi:glutamate N-acetyltransferase/amino-acid N-acetyltransferase